MRLDDRDSGYHVDIIISGFPGKSVCHGGLGWSTIVLLQGHGRVALIDVGTFGMRQLLIDALAARGLKPDDVTDLLLTHAHHDHAINWVLFPHARIVIGDLELSWSLEEPWGRTMVPELYMKELKDWPTLHRAGDGEEVMPGVTAIIGPGHTPGHFVYLLEGRERDIIFTGDAAKNRAELISRAADMTYDPDVTRATIEAIWALWQRKPGNIVVPGHDKPMVLEDGVPTFIGSRISAIQIFSGDSLDQITTIDLEVS